jgi:hypothetical protein
MTTITLNPGFFSQRSLADWAFAVLTALGMVYAFSQYQSAMDVYEQGILVASVPAVVWLG